MAEHDEKESFPNEKQLSTVEVQGTDEDVRVDVHTGLYDGVQRNMKQRHIQMIALAGVRRNPMSYIAGVLTF